MKPAGSSAVRWAAAAAVLASAWGLAAASVVLSWVFALPDEPLPGVFLSQAPAQVQSRFDDIGVVVASIYAPVSALLIVRRPNPVAAILATHAVGSGLAAFGVQYGLLGAEVPGLPLWGLIAYTAGWGFVPGTFLTAVIPLLLLRDGPGRFGRLLIPFACTFAAVATFLSMTQQTQPAPINPLALPWPLYQSFVADAYAAAATGTILLSLATAVVLIRRFVATPTGSRHALGWLTAGHVFLTASYLATVVPESVEIPEPLWLLGVIAPIAGQVFYPAAVLVLGLDQRIWGVDVAVSRVLVTAIVAVLAVGSYYAVTTVTTLLVGEVTTTAGLLTAAVIAVALHPVRLLVTRWVALLVYGESGDPVHLAGDIGAHVGELDARTGGLGDLAEALRAALRLDGLEIDPGVPAVAAQRAGTLDDHPELIPLGAEGRGALRATGRRSAPLGRAERDALVDLAGLIAVVVRLTEAGAVMRDARTGLIAARHEQRRVLRRELHDGMGPALAGAGFALAAAANLWVQNPGEARILLDRVDEQLAERERMLRRLAQAGDLPADMAVRHDLTRTLTMLVADFETAGPAIVLRAEGDLPRLDGAVHRAVQLIASEALVNAVRHANATLIELSLTWEHDHLRLSIEDDGTGTPMGIVPGVGSASMGEWAGSVGAQIRARSEAGRGTRVVVRFAPHLVTESGRER